MADAGASLIDMKRWGNWKSDTVAMGYIEESKKSKTKFASMIGSQIGSKRSIAAMNDKREMDDDGDINEKDDDDDDEQPVIKKRKKKNKLYKECTFTNCTFNF